MTERADPRHDGGFDLSSILVVAGGLVLAALLWSALVYHLAETRAGEVKQAERDVANLSTALAEQVSRLVTGADEIMRMMAADERRYPAHFDAATWIERASALGPIAGHLAVFDAKGDPVASPSPLDPATTANVAAGDEFASLAKDADADEGLIVGRTVAGPGKPALRLERRLTAADGSFAGMVRVSLDPTRITQKFEALELGRAGSVALFGTDGHLRARMPAVAGMYDLDYRTVAGGAGVFAALRQAPNGTFERASNVDGITRLYGYRRIAGLPLVVAVGRSMEEILAPYQAEKRATIAAGTIATLVVAALVIILLQAFAIRRHRDRQLAETHAALREAEAGLRGVFDNSTDILVVHRILPDGSFAFDMINQAAANARHLDPAAARGRRLEDVMPPEAAAEARAALQRVAKSGEIVRFHGDGLLGDSRVYETILVPLFGDESRQHVTRILVSIRDITLMRESERAIAGSEARYRLLAETTSDVITRLSLDYEREYVSPACRSLLGFEQEEMLGKVPSNSMHPDDAPRIRELARQLIEGQVPDARLTATYRTRHKLGHWVWVEASMSLGRDAQGTPDALICSLRDVTERRAAESAMAASEARFRLLAENTSELIILGHDDGRRSYISAASTRLLGYTPDELAGMRSQDWVHPDDLAKLAEASLAHGSIATTIVCRVRRKDGTWIWVEGIFRRIPDTQDAGPTIVATFRDISDRQAQSEALREAKESAEAARAAAEHASQAKSDFLASMSHEIRTPLNGILGFTDILLEDHALAGDQRRHVERIQNAGAALRTVVDDILHFSKIEAGHVELDVQPFRPLALVDDTVSIVRGLAEQKGLDLSVDVDPALPKTLLGDADRLRQVLLNLLNNAVKFTPSGFVTLSVTLDAAREGTASLRFAVADSGIGIPPAKRSRLFQRFSQVDGSISREFGGTGLGLAICRGLVELMGGTIGIESTSERGSLFWFKVRLPTADGLDRAKGDATRAQPTMRPALILLAEDHAINQELARAVIEAAGHRVDVVEDGAEVLRAVQRKAYDLVLMDVQMPVLDGIAATSQIRALPAPLCDLPIVAMTANVLPDQVARFRAAGMDDHIGKPFKKHDLHAIIDRWAYGRAVAPGQAPPAEAETPAPIDRALVSNILGVVGADAFARLFGSATTQVHAMLGRHRDAPDRARLARDAHGLIGATGTLGLVELAALLRSLEQKCLEDADVDDLLARIDSARTRSLQSFDPEMEAA